MTCIVCDIDDSYGRAPWHSGVERALHSKPSPLTSCVDLGELLILSEPESSLDNRDINTYFKR